MNVKAESFKNFVGEQQPNVFQVEELKDDKQEAVVFRSTVSIAGQQLPLLVLIDTSVFAIIRVQICPRALDEIEKPALYEFINEQNVNYKPFKFFLNDAGDLMLENCLLFTGDEVDGNEIYLMFNVIISYLNDRYRDIMKLIWGGSNEVQDGAK